MKKNIKKGPSKRLVLKPWVKEALEFIKVIWNCTVHLAIVVLVISLSIRCFGISKAEMRTDLSSSSMIVDVVDIPEPEPEQPVESHEEKIQRLVNDVETGKAGNGQDRKDYLGEDYDEVQSIIEKIYKDKKPKSSNKVTKATSGNKAVYQNYAYDLVINKYAWSEEDFNALVKLWEKESNWNPNAHNKSSGAHGIPQSLPASKMASYGDDYMTNYETQIQWGLNYIKNRYGTPSKAWQHSCNKGWY